MILALDISQFVFCEYCRASVEEAIYSVLYIFLILHDSMQFSFNFVSASIISCKIIFSLQV